MSKSGTSSRFPTWLAGAQGLGSHLLLSQVHQQGGKPIMEQLGLKSVWAWSLCHSTSHSFSFLISLWKHHLELRFFQIYFVLNLCCHSRIFVPKSWTTLLTVVGGILVFILPEVRTLRELKAASRNIYYLFSKQAWALLKRLTRSLDQNRR